MWVHGGGVGGCHGGGGRRCGFLLWVICEFMVVKVEDCRGDGGGVAMGFDLGMFFMMVVVVATVAAGG